MALLDGKPEDEVFRERDEKAARRARAERSKKEDAPSKPQVVPRPIKPVNPETT